MDKLNEIKITLYRDSETDQLEMELEHNFKDLQDVKVILEDMLANINISLRHT